MYRPPVGQFAGADPDQIDFKCFFSKICWVKLSCTLLVSECKIWFNSYLWICWSWRIWRQNEMSGFWNIPVSSPAPEIMSHLICSHFDSFNLNAVVSRLAVIFTSNKSVLLQIPRKVAGHSLDRIWDCYDNSTTVLDIAIARKWGQCEENHCNTDCVPPLNTCISCSLPCSAPTLNRKDQFSVHASICIIWLW